MKPPMFSEGKMEIKYDESLDEDEKITNDRLIVSSPILYWLLKKAINQRIDKKWLNTAKKYINYIDTGYKDVATK